MRLLEAARKDIPLDTFEPAALVKQIGTDPQQLFEWVRKNTYFVPYRGFLKGAQGVMMDRRGSSADRAVLLAELLRIAGHDSRLAHATLTKERATSLSRVISKVPLQPAASVNTGAEPTDAQLEEHAKRFDLSGEQVRLKANAATQRVTSMREEVGRRVKSEAPFLIAKVGEPTGLEPEDDRDIEALRDYWWVQLSRGGNWTDLDLLGNSTPPALHGPADVTYAYGGDGSRLPVASEFIHQIDIRVVFEQRGNGKRNELTALTYGLRPAEVGTQMIVLRVLPRNWPNEAAPPPSVDPSAWFNEQALKQKVWVPVLMVGNRKIPGLAVTDSGDLQSSTVSTNLQLQKPAASINDAFGGGEPEPANELSAGWVDYEIKAPGERPRVIRRELFDLVPPSVRHQEQAATEIHPSESERLERSLNLMQEVQMLFQVSRLTPEYAVSRWLGEALQNRSALVSLASELQSHRPIGQKTVDQIVPTAGQLLDLAFARFDWSPVGREVFLGEPSILTYRTKYGLDSAQRSVRWHGYDIVNGRVEAPGDGRMRFRTRVAQGVADTNAEGVLLGTEGVVNAGTHLSQSAEPEKSWGNVVRNQSSVPTDGAWPEKVRELLQRDVKDGYVLVLPSSADTTPATGGWTWWRIDQRTGDTIGRGDLGWGQAAVEYVIGGWLTFLSFFVACNVYAIAKNNPSPGKCFCFALGIGVGIALGAVPLALGAEWAILAKAAQGVPTLLLCLL